MNDRVPVEPSTDASGLGEVRRVFKVGARNLAFAYFLATVPCAIGVGALTLLVWKAANGSRDVVLYAVLLLVAALSLWGGARLWRSADRLRRSLVAVHAGGLSSFDGQRHAACRWDQVEAVWVREMHHFEETSLAVAAIPVPGTATRSYSHSSHRYTLRLEGGAELEFTDQFDGVADLGAIIQEATVSALLPRACEEVAAGGVVRFGELSVSREGLSNGEQTLPWDAVEGVGVAGKVCVRAGGQWYRFSQASISRIPNLALLLALATDMARGE